MATGYYMRDPLGGLSDDNIAKVVRDYRNLTLTVEEVMRRNKIGSARLRAILAAKMVKPRGARPFGDGKRNISQVFLGMQPAAKTSDDAVEQAKQALRRRGHVVYAAEISEGPAMRGLIRVDHKRLTPAEVIQAARGMK